jgi:hypothetical protein
MAKGETRILFLRDTQMLLVRVPIIFVGLITYGMHGVIFGRVFTGLLSAFVNMILVKRFIGVGVFKQLAANGRTLVSVAAMAAGVSFVSTLMNAAVDRPALVLHLAVLVGSGAALYCGTTLLLWLAMGRPEGPETEVQRILAKILSSVRPAVRQFPAA